MKNEFFDDINNDSEEFEQINDISEIKDIKNENEDEKQDEVIYVEREILSLNFKDFPKIIKNKILYSAGITALINVMLIGLLIGFSFNVYLLFILIAIDFVSFGSIYYNYNVTKNMEFRIFDGFIVSCENKGIPGTSSTYKRIVMCNEEETKFISFDYNGKAKINNGFPVSIYIPRNEEVKIVNDIPYIENILGATFGERKENLNINKDTENIDDFLG